MTLKRLPLVYIGLIVGAGPVACPPATAQGSTQLIAMIDTFLEHPFHEDVRVALLDSAEKRSDVTVTISISVTPFLCYADTQTIIRAFDALLFTAFVAGNMREQLHLGHKGNQPEAGLRAVLHVYSVIRSRVSNYNVPEVDIWSNALTTRPFKEYADSIAQDARPQCARETYRFPKGAALAPERP